MVIRNQNALAKQVRFFASALGLAALILQSACAPFKSSLQTYADQPIKPTSEYKAYENFEDENAGPDESEPHDHSDDSDRDRKNRDQSTGVNGPVGDCRASTDPTPCFPVAGPARFRNDFGMSRSGGRKHAGNDVMAAKMTPVVAVDAGVVEKIALNSGMAGTYVAIVHSNNVRTVYMHLNNDSPGTDDGRGQGVAPGLRQGMRVNKGQLIGWVGDSGNAESTSPHLHFELQMSSRRSSVRPTGFYPVNPFRMLKTSERFKARVVRQ